MYFERSPAHVMVSGHCYLLSSEGIACVQSGFGRTEVQSLEALHQTMKELSRRAQELIRTIHNRCYLTAVRKIFQDGKPRSSWRIVAKKSISRPWKTPGCVMHHTTAH